MFIGRFADFSVFDIVTFRSHGRQPIRNSNRQGGWSFRYSYTMSLRFMALSQPAKSSRFCSSIPISTGPFSRLVFFLASSN